MLYLFYVLFLYIKYKIGFLDFEQFVKTSIDYLAKKNIIFVKLCQWLSYDYCKDKVIANRISNYMESYCNHCPFQESDIDYISYNSVKDKLNLEDQPSFTGSIALCYLGEYEGKKIICKILRKRIKQQMEEFENLVYQIWYIICWIEYFNLIRIHENKKFIIDLKIEILNSYINQSDFELECRNIKLFQDTYKNYNDIKVPNIWKSFTDQNNKIIVMEYLEPYKVLTELTREEKYIYFRIFVDHVINSVLVEFVLHSDLHLGNIIFQKEGDNYKLGIIDLGLLNVMSTIEQKNAMCGICSEIIENLDYENGKYFTYCCLKYIEKEKDQLGITDEQYLYLQKYYNENTPTDFETFIEGNNFFLHALKKGIKFSFLTSICLYFPPLTTLAHKLNGDKKDSLVFELRQKINEFYNEY